MKILVARVTIFGLVFATYVAQSEARGGHGVQPTIHDGRGIPYRKNFGYYGPKWRPWPGDQPAGPDLPPAQPSGPAAPQLPAVDVPPPADEVRKTNPIQAGPQETVEPPSDPLPSTVLPTIPAPREGAEQPLPEQPPQPARPPVRRPGARNGTRIFRSPTNAGDADDAPPQLASEETESEALQDVAPEITQPKELTDEIDLDHVFGGQSEKSAPDSLTAASPDPTALGPGEANTAFAISPAESEAANEVVQLRYRAMNGPLTVGIQPTTSVLTVAAEAGDDHLANIGASAAADVASVARPSQMEYARPSQKRTTVRASSQPRNRMVTANPLRGGSAGAISAELAPEGANAVAAPLQVARENPMISPDNPMRKPEAAAAGANPLRQ